MSILNNSLLLGAPAAAAGGISRSLRFNSSDSAYLSRTPGSAGNRRTWTFAAWMKRGNISTSNYYTIFDALPAAGQTANINIPDFNTGAGVLEVTQYTTTYDYRLVTAQVFRDPSAWYHICVAFDSTQATASNRIKIYVNGEQVTAFTTATYPTQNLDGGINNAVAHNIGRNVSQASRFWDGLLADCYLIDGSALTPSSFTETDATTGQLIPKAFSGSYGSQGWHLEFADNSAATAAALGKDTSGKGNNWTPNNLSVTAGAGNDSLVDVPTNGTASSGGDAGGVVTGNYAVLNPLRSAVTLSNGNLDATGYTGGFSTFGTIGVSNGKWYWEVTITAVGQTYYPGMGINTNASLAPTTQSGSEAAGYMYLANGQKYNSGSLASYGASFAANDVIGVALDMDNGTVTFYKNGSTQGQAYSGITGTAFPCLTLAGSSQSCSVNFGARPFQTAAPSGFKALCTANLPAPLVTKPSTVMDVKLFTGNGSTQSITGLGFSPDFAWFKRRSSAFSHELFDIIRGGSNVLFSDLTSAEANNSALVTSFNSDGVSVGSALGANGSSVTSVLWAWDAGSSTVTNTQGSITGGAQVRVNATAGFSVVTWTSDGSSSIQTMGTGLNATPGLIIAKNRSISGNWWVWHSSFSNQVRDYLLLQTTDAKVTAGVDVWSTSSTTFGIRQATIANNTNQCVAYVFSPVVGYSAMGSFTASNGAFVYTGFRPRFLLLKCSDTVGRSWVLLDTARGQYNINDKELYANLSDAEYTTSNYDLVSNGFVVRSTSAAYNTGTWIYYAVAESPFQYARAR